MEASNLEQAYNTILDQVLTVRKKLLERLTMIRKKTVTVCDSRIDQGRKLNDLRVLVEEILLETVSDQASSVSGLRTVSSLLIRLREQLNSEVMRTVLLPEEVSCNLTESLVWSDVPGCQPEGGGGSLRGLLGAGGRQLEGPEPPGLCSEGGKLH